MLSESELFEEEADVVGLLSLSNWVVVSIINIYIKYRIVPLGQDLPDFSLHLLSGFFVGQLFLGDNTLELDITRDQISGWHEMVVVDDLNERLDLGSPFDLLLAHALCYSQGISLDSSDQSVSELLVLHRNTSELHELTFFPSSYCFTMIAFFPACLPARSMTTLPAFIL